MRTVERTRVLIEHLDPLTRAGLAYTLSCHRHEFEDVDARPGMRAHVVIADYDSGMRRLSEEPACAASGECRNVLIVTQRDGEAEIRHALEVGAKGFLLATCSVDELIEGIHAVRSGLSYLGRMPAHRIAQSLTHTPLTGRELEVLRLMATGKANKVIARQLGIAVGTVKAHAKSILAKLDATSRTEATFVAEQRGLLSKLQGGVASSGPACQSRFSSSMRSGAAALGVA